jgi:N-acyl homoserine lactone hydrolase
MSEATSVASPTGVRRVDFGYFVRPAEETGTGVNRVEPCLGYLVEHPGGNILVDTVMGGHPDIDAHYQPRRRSLTAALAAVGAQPQDIRLVVNCHLHFDHCGGNPELVGRPVFVQSVELDAARNGLDYTLPELVDFTGARYERLNGEAEIATGVRVIPTPGHTAGHQSLAVSLVDGTVIVAGQSHDSASAYAAEALAARARSEEPTQDLPPLPPWMERLQQLSPRRVVFAHDNAVWQP